MCRQGIVPVYLFSCTLYLFSYVPTYLKFVYLYLYLYLCPCVPAHLYLCTYLLTLCLNAKALSTGSNERPHGV